MIDVVVYFESKIVKVFLFNLLEESSHQNEKWIYRVTQWMLQQRLWFDHQGYSIYPSLDINSNLTKLYKFLTTLLKFWVKRCTTLRQKNLVNWVNFGTQTDSFGFHCIETLVSSNLNFFLFLNRRELSEENSTQTIRKPWPFWAKLKRHWDLPHMCWIWWNGKFHLNQILNLRKGKKTNQKSMVCSWHN